MELDARPDDPGPPGHSHPDNGRRQPEGHRLHVRQPADLAHRRDNGVRDAADPRRAVPAAVGPVGGPGGLPPNDRRGPGRHPHRPVRVHHRGPHRGHRHRGRLRRLHPDREPRPEPGDHEQDGADQPAARIHRGAGRRLDRQPDRRHIRRFRRGAAGHPDGRSPQVLVKEAWRATAPDQSQASPPAAEPDESAVQRGERPSTPAGHFPRGLGERLRHGRAAGAAAQHHDRP